MKQWGESGKKRKRRKKKVWKEEIMEVKNISEGR